MPVEGAQPHPFREVHEDGRAPAERTRPLAIETPIALEINGIGYAVMMATPIDLTDYALGFCISEQLIASKQQFLSADAVEVPSGGWMLRIQLEAAAGAPLMERARLRLAEGSCGLCGIESLQQVLKPLQSISTPSQPVSTHVFSALRALPEHQPLGRETRAVHAAAFCTPEGEIVLAREDVGRHNAFDKLIGALAHAGIDPSTGFALLTARCSFELVQKAIIAGMPALATLSAASTMAVEQARRHGLHLITLLRDDSYLES
ncbi:formate dehydrogenase accessory sulfurtransferase FdhD [Novosphingobium cyanobacteriorum]|uniref:Sulfur carrier protein FdhD n=1 Tax=Novosphingobium cyanobacteriorum TaxID=3024215 RepID=A0ABT6CDV9_9SPHN|nr:formate dehydrogenase accessory sulfurtransferase FdhD [Novosphingobium cyanobacteriorum]MDF8332106.1 formate dehydrogenase accessory sulfurtransferase FdhD [Novosphingobium cyanobacteriorum]